MSIGTSKHEVAIKQRVTLSTDHGGLDFNCESISRLHKTYVIFDLGAVTFYPSDDYFDCIQAVAQAVGSGQAHLGIIVYDSGVGACIEVNVASCIQACLCHDTYSAEQRVEPDE